MEDTIVGEWLKSLHVDEHTESFIDNGYDDLEICKQISAPDLDAIGVVDGRQRGVILDAVQRLREEGAASVYFTVEEAQAARGCDRTTLSTRRRWRGSGSCGGSTASTPGEASKHILGNSEPGVSRSSSCSSVDAYEAGRAELVRLPHSQLHTMLAHLLERDNVNLTVPPYTDKDGSRGVLEGLASRYADQFTTHYQDVLDLLDQLRTRALLTAAKPAVVVSTSAAPVASSASSSVAIAGSSAMTSGVEDGVVVLSAAAGNGLGSDDGAISVGDGGMSVKAAVVAPSVSTGQLSSLSSSPEPGVVGHGGRYLPTHYASTDQAIYVPGKYNPSSCLSDAEEDEIYGYTGGDGGGRPTPPPRNTPSTQGYLNPRSQFIYELPPLGGRAGGKRRLGLGRLIKTLRRDLKRATPSRLKVSHHTASGRSGVGGGGPVGCGHVMACGVAGAAGVTSDESGNGIIVATSSGGAEGAVADTATDHTPLMVLPGYYYNQQHASHQHHNLHPHHHHHQQQQSSSSSSTTLPQHQHQHSNTTNTTTLTATDSSTSNSSSPRGSQHSSRSSGAHSAATAQSSAPLNPHYWSGGLQPGGGGQQGWPPPHTAPVTPASTTPRDSGLQQAIERLKEQEVLRRRQDQFIEHEQMLRDLREGLLRRGAGGGDPHPSQRTGETAVFYTSHPSHGVGSYMYADQVGVGRAMMGEVVGEGVSGDKPLSPTPPGLPHHWYDEPPYESDPEDFLVGTTDLSSTELGARSLRDSLREEDVISLRTAGDISLPRSSDPLLHHGFPAGACHQLQHSAAAVAAYYNYHHSRKRPLPYHDPHLSSVPYRDHRDLFGDTYREPWASGAMGTVGQDDISSDRDPSRGKSKRDKDKGIKENKDKYGPGHAREQHTSRMTLSKDLTLDAEYSFQSKNAVFGSYSLDHDEVGSQGAAGTLPPHLLSRLAAVTSAHHHPVYDNISGGMGQTGYMLATGGGTTNGLHHHATANGLSSSAATTPTSAGGGHPFKVDHNWRHHLHHHHQMTSQATSGTVGGYNTSVAYQQPVRQQRHHHAQYHQYYHPHHHANDGSGGGTLANGGTFTGGIDPSCHHQTQASGVAAPPSSARHNLQLRGLTSQQHFLHMQARQHNHHHHQQLQQQYPSVGDVGGASTSPDYNLRWDLHNITVTSGPSRLSSLSVDSQRSDPSDLRHSSLMVSGDVTSSLRCDGFCETRAKTGVASTGGGGAIYPSSPLPHPHAPAVTAPPPPPPPSGYVCCGDNSGCGAASTCCCCLSAVAVAASSDPIVGLTNNLSDQLTLGELRRSQQIVRQSLPPRPGCLTPGSAGQGRLMAQSRPLSLMPSVCNTTDCHLDGGRRLCPAVAAQSLADLSSLHGPPPQPCCGAALVPLGMPLRLASSGGRGTTATVDSAGAVITAAAVAPSLSSCGDAGLIRFKPEHVKGEINLISQLGYDRVESGLLTPPSGKSCAPPCSLLLNPLIDEVSVSSKHSQRMGIPTNMATSGPIVEGATNTSYHKGLGKAAAEDPVQRSPLASAPPSAGIVMTPFPAGSVVKSPSSSSVVSLSAALQKTPAHIV